VLVAGATGGVGQLVTAKLLDVSAEPAALRRPLLLQLPPAVLPGRP
jgi:hypothetical protein